MQIHKKALLTDPTGQRLAKYRPDENHGYFWLVMNEPETVNSARMGVEASSL
jgi:hypothetical protein